MQQILPGQALPTMPMTRLDKVLERVDLSAGPGLEIGPCNSPLLRKDQAQLRYVDYLPSDQLREKYGSPQFLGEVPVAAIVDTEIVWEMGRQLQDCLQPPKPVHWVLASHVVEHATDLVRWLAEIEEVLVPGGVLSLVVPDKRFTFDIQRAESTFGDVLEAYLTAAKQPRLKNVYDYFAMAVRVTSEDLRQQVLNPHTMTLYYSTDEAVTRVRALAEKADYVDIHNLVVTPWSFIEILRSMISVDLTGFEVGAFRLTEPQDFEFFISLVKLPTGLTSDERRSRQLASLPLLPTKPAG